ncbi:MAG: putative lipase, partial [Bacteroidales bacterium]|nr:putative lipase [Bacteroidales bacterium]
MKKQLIFLLIAVSFSVNVLHAQMQSFTQMFDSLLMHVSRTDATTGVLYNRVLPFSGLAKFTQPDTANADIFVQAYSELYEAAFVPAARLPFTSDNLQNIIVPTGNIVDVGLLHYRYNLIIDSLIWQKLYFDADSVIRENSSFAPSLYTEYTSFLATPFRTIIDTTSVAFRFRDLLRFDNTPNPITQLLIDFGESNGMQTVGLNTTITVNYEISGIYVLTINAILANGDTITSYSQINVIDKNEIQADKAGGGNRQKSGWKWIDQYEGGNAANALPPFTAIIGCPEIEDPNDQEYYTGNVWIYYADSTRTLRKPILLVDGFDPGNVRHWESHDSGGKSLWKMFDYPDPDTTAHVGDSLNIGRQLLEDYGYDLVILDPREGGGYIEKNAMLCIQVINWINNRLAENNSNEQIVVIGPSMGGQITRYALAYMEANPNANTHYGKHNCRLWVSYDSPHGGANISMGVQALAHYFRGLPSVKKLWEEKVNCPAAREMLIEHMGSSLYNTY